MKTSFKFFQSLMVLGMLLGLNSCSLRDRSSYKTIRIELPSEWKLNRPQSSMSILGFPQSLANFQCFAINVSGPGIQGDTRLGCNGPNNGGVGMLAGFVSVDQPVLEILVPAGASRKVDLIGIESLGGCPDINQLLSDPTALNAYEFTYGEPMLLGSAVTDIFDDTSIEIQAMFDPLHSVKAFSQCYINTAKELYFGVTMDSPYVQRNRCTKLEVYTNTPLQTFENFEVSSELIDTDPSYTALYNQELQCLYPSDPPSPLDPIQLSAYSNYGNYFYVKTTLASGSSFKIRMNATDPSWRTTTQTFVAVQNRMEFSSPDNPNMDLNTCASLDLNHFIDENDTPGDLGTFVLVADHSNTDPNTSIKFYENLFDCTDENNEFPVLGSNGSRRYFQINASEMSTKPIYYRSSSYGHVFIGARKLDASGNTFDQDTQPARANIDFPIPPLLNVTASPSDPTQPYYLQATSITFNGSCVPYATVQIQLLDNLDPPNSILYGSQICNIDGGFELTYTGSPDHPSYNIQLIQTMNGVSSPPESFFWTYPSPSPIPTVVPTYSPAGTGTGVTGNTTGVTP